MREQKRIRRVVAGNDDQGQSQVLWDGLAPNVHPGGELTNGWTDYWVWTQTPAPLSAKNDDANLKYNFPGPRDGGHLRTVQGWPPGPDYDPAKDVRRKPYHSPTRRPDGNTWDRGGRNVYTSDMHKTESIDFAILLEGQRNLILDDGEVTWKPGDIIIDVGAYHQWTSPDDTGIVLYDMVAARFADGPMEAARTREPVMKPPVNMQLPDGVKPSRRIVCLDQEPGKSSLVSDGPTPDMRFDPARPGYASARMWIIDSMPAKIAYETLHLPHTIEPPPNGCVLRVVTVPPDDGWKRKVGENEVKTFFRSMGSPNASTYSPKAPHPYMQKTKTLDFCVVLEGEIVLVLDKQEVRMKAGEIAVLLGVNHAWSNYSNNPAVIAISSHDGA